MSDYLCIRVSESELKPWSIVSWSIISPQSQIVASGLCLLKDLTNELPEPEQVLRRVLIVPGESVLFKSAFVPPTQQRHLKRILPFVVEEFIIDPIESMHLATPLLHSGDYVSIACVKRSTMRNWLEALEIAGIQPDYMFADVLCVPQQEINYWSILVDANRALFRDSERTGIVLDEQSAESVLRIAISHNSETTEAETANQQVTVLPAQVGLISVVEDNQGLRKTLSQNSELLQAHIENEQAASLDEFSESLDEPKNNDAENSTVEEEPASRALEGDVLEGDVLDNKADLEHYAAGEFIERLDRYIRSENIETQSKHYSETASEFLMISAVKSLDTGFNLLQGDFKAVSANAESKRFMRKISVAVGLCLGLFMLLTLGGGGYLNYRADQYFDKSVAVYRSLFPKQRRVFDPVKQMKNRLKSGALVGTRSEFLPLLDAASKSLAGLDENAVTETSISQLRYDVQRGKIAIDIKVSNIDQLEVYRDLLTAEGLVVDILSANRDGDIINGRIQIARH